MQNFFAILPQKKTRKMLEATFILMDFAFCRLLLRGTADGEETAASLGRKQR